MDLNYSPEQQAVGKMGTRIYPRQPRIQKVARKVPEGSVSNAKTILLALGHQEGLGRRRLAKAVRRHWLNSTQQQHIFDEVTADEGALQLIPFGLQWCLRSSWRSATRNSGISPAENSPAKAGGARLQQAGLRTPDLASPGCKAERGAISTSSTARKLRTRWANTPTGSSARCAPPAKAGSRKAFVPADRHEDAGIGVAPSSCSIRSMR